MRSLSCFSFLVSLLYVTTAFTLDPTTTTSEILNDAPTTTLNPEVESVEVVNETQTKDDNSSEEESGQDVATTTEIISVADPGEVDSEPEKVTSRPLPNQQSSDESSSSSSASSEEYSSDEIKKDRNIVYKKKDKIYEKQSRKTLEKPKKGKQAL